MRTRGPSGSRERDGSAWVALAACTLSILVASGSRFSFAAFVEPIERELGADRALLSAAASLNLIAYGISQPIVARAATRFHPGRIMLAGLALMALGGLGAAATTNPAHLLLFYGLLPGVGFAAASVVPSTAVLVPWFPSRPGFALGAASSAIPAGQALFLPIAAWLIPLLGWRMAYVILGAVTLAVAAPLLLTLRLARTEAVPLTAAAIEPPRGGGLPFWLLGFGFLVCGYTDQFIGLHLLPFLQGQGIDAVSAAASLAALTLVGMAGSLASGPLADGWSARGLLVALYGSRLLALPLLILIAGPGQLPLVWLFSVVFGLGYIANNAPAVRTLRQLHTPATSTRLMGWLQFFHQLGGAIGVASGGLSVALVGSYLPAFVFAAGLAGAAAIASLRLPRQRQTRNA